MSICSLRGTNVVGCNTSTYYLSLGTKYVLTAKSHGGMLVSHGSGYGH